MVTGVGATRLFFRGVGAALGAACLAYVGGCNGAAPLAAGPAQPDAATRSHVTETPALAREAQHSETAPSVAGSPACANAGLSDFACSHNDLCSGVDLLDDELTLTEFLCTARVTHNVRGPLRVGDVLADLPVAFRKNFTLKHGTKERGLRGHAQELMADVVSDALAQRSQSADLDFPRVIMWDEATGFTISYNGGLTVSDGSGRAQTGANRLDLMGWDAEARAFQLWALDLPVTDHEVSETQETMLPWSIEPFQPTDKDDNCTHCHGPQSRPIWPMYPDWPGFYGSDNDELTAPSGHQATERDFLTYFRRCVAPGPVGTGSGPCKKVRDAALDPKGHQPSRLVDTRRRYDTLFDNDVDAYLRRWFDRVDGDDVRAYITGLDGRFGRATVRKIRSKEAMAAVRGDDEALRAWLGLGMHETWPYRPNRSEHSTDPSRAFFHRPNLRLGVLYNRLVALNVFARLQAHANYARFGRLLALSLMDCGFGGDTKTQVATLTAFEAAVTERLTAHRLTLGDTKAPGYRIPYPALLATFDLQVRDLDMRYSYPNRRFDQFDRGYRVRGAVNNPMRLGYLAYDANDHNEANGASLYWNSYWDGSATTDELLVAMVLGDLATREPAYEGLYTAHTLTAKYERFTSRHVLDAVFFERMDALSGWVPLPYPQRLDPVLHRQSFERRQSGKRIFVDQYAAVCNQLRADLASAAR